MPAALAMIPARNDKYQIPSTNYRLRARQQPEAGSRQQAVTLDPIFLPARGRE